MTLVLEFPADAEIEVRAYSVAELRSEFVETTNLEVVS